MIGETIQVEEYQLKYIDINVLALESNILIQSAIVNGYSYVKGKLHLEITYADFISGENEGGSGFRLDFSKNISRTITITSDDGTTMKLITPGTEDSNLPNVKWEDVEDINFNGRFIYFTFEDGEVVSMREKYIP
jgi:hypothetical protein